MQNKQHNNSNEFNELLQERLIEGLNNYPLATNRQQITKRKKEDYESVKQNEMECFVNHPRAKAVIKIAERVDYLMVMYAGSDLTGIEKTPFMKIFGSQISTELNEIFLKNYL